MNGRGHDMRKTSGLLLPVLLFMVGCVEEPAGPPLDLRHDTRALMAGMIDASADALWDAVGTVWDENGEQHWQPETEEDWLAVTGAAMTLVESGNLLMLGDRPRDTEQWMRFCGGGARGGRGARSGWRLRQRGSGLQLLQRLPQRLLGRRRGARSRQSLSQASARVRPADPRVSVATG